MEFIRRLEPPHTAPRGCALAIGNFDGLHLGHLQLIERTRDHAAKRGVAAAVMMFEPNPREFFRREQLPPRIEEFRDKFHRLQRLGVDRLYCLRFDAKFAAIKAPAFVDQLVEALVPSALVIGEDFRFGAGRQGNVELLQQELPARGVVVDIVGDVEVDGERCSSTGLRQALGEADLARAARLLGRPYAVIGRVRRGLQLGRKLGMPTANLMLHRPPALKLGVYAIFARDAAMIDGQRYAGVASVGVRPTIGGTAPLIEAHLFDHHGDWYGREMEVEFHRFMRPELNFDSLETLAAQMRRDGEQARTLCRAA